MGEILNTPALVLNRSWRPVNVTTVRHAISLAFAQRAMLVCPVTYTPHDFTSWVSRGVISGCALNGISFAIEVPEVLVLNDFNRLPELGVVFNKRNLQKRDGRVCQYCGRSIPAGFVTIDHVMPVSRGGETSWSNCVISCRQCNNRKGDRTPREAGMKLLKRPKKPAWAPHYAAYARVKRPASWDNFLAPSLIESLCEPA